MKFKGVFAVKSTLFLFSLLVYLTGYSQNSEPSTQERRRIFHAGFQAKGLFQWTEHEQAGFTDLGMRPGFAYGLNAEFGVTPNVLLNTGVFHEFRSFGIEFRDTAGASPKLVNTVFTAQYLNVPFGLTMRTGRIADKWSIVFRAGLNAHFLLNSSVRREGSLGNGTEEDGNLYLSSAWVGIYGDAGFLYYFHQQTALSFQIGYSAGLSSILASNAYPFMVGDAWNNTGNTRLNSIHVGVGILF